MRYLLLLIIALAGNTSLTAQWTYVYFHNNTTLDFNAATAGNPAPHPDDWTGFNGTIVGLQPETQIMSIFRDWATADSPSGFYYLTTTLTFPTGETVDLKMEYDVEVYDFFSNPVPRTNIRQSVAGPGFSDPWQGDNTIRDQAFTVNGVDYFVRYQAYFTGGYDDVMFSIYEADDTPYSVNPADLSNASVFNLMSYNVFMRPTSLFPDDDQATRAEHIADYTHDMDAIILQEVFDNDTRATLLANLATEYPYQTTVVDDPGNPLEDGGVVIVSRWPIEVEDQYLWGDVCYEDDCTANKGVKYARIDKLGTKYHVFGTHMDAFNKTEDIDTRKQQLVDWKNYIDGKNIPTSEAVLMGGDYNVDKFANKLGEYDSLWGNFSALEPTYEGFPSTWDPLYNHYNAGEPYDPEFLDYVLARGDHLPPTIDNTNHSLVMRSTHTDLWRIFDLSDHYAIWGRFEFPTLPVELTEINGYYDANQGYVVIDWTTAMERNNSHFQVERSLDGTSFHYIGQIQGRGDSSAPHNYQYLDMQVPTGQIYYRLRQYDYDGSYTLSEVVALQVPKGKTMVSGIFPNPTQQGGIVNVGFRAAAHMPVRITVHNVVGEQIAALKFSAQEGNNIFSLPIQDWGTGIFSLNINAGNYSNVQRFLISD
jgi:sphingomyelin phosphodiesterase